MREPRLSHLKIDEKATAKIRRGLARHRDVTITIHVDTKGLHALKEISRRTGVPYRGLVTRVLQEGVKGRVSAEARLDRLEQELKKVRRILVA